MRRRCVGWLFWSVLAGLLTSGGCGPVTSPQQQEAGAGDPIAQLLTEAPDTADSPVDGTPLAKMGYSVQVGAFSSLDNAVRLERRLKERDIDAYYFRHDSGLYKVRFGNYADYRPARREAERLQAAGLIGRFFIVSPADYAAAGFHKNDQLTLRTELVSTAKRFIGVPYRWGGEDRQSGFDCSGLTMVCYRLNGLDLPRNSRSQYRKGRWVPKAELKKGDLVFFATRGGRRVSHVGMYIGDGKFIHAPRTGKTVRVESLSNSWFARRYMGGRTYL